MDKEQFISGYGVGFDEDNVLLDSLRVVDVDTNRLVAEFVSSGEEIVFEGQFVGFEEKDVLRCRWEQKVGGGRFMFSLSSFEPVEWWKAVSVYLAATVVAGLSAYGALVSSSFALVGYVLVSLLLVLTMYVGNRSSSFPEPYFERIIRAFDWSVPCGRGDVSN